MGLTRQLCETIHAFDYDSLGSECVGRVKQAIQDGIAVALVGCKEPQIQISVRHMAALGGKPQASIWGWGAKGSAVQAAYVNAASIHVLDFEPMSSPPTHCVSPTVPVAMALAETHDITGKQIIAAVAKGTEIQARLQLAGNFFEASRLKFHPPGTAGVLGSAVVASELLALGVEGLQHAIGLAASRTGGLLANVGSMTKCTHSANAAGSGLDAALLVSEGFKANPDSFEASRGIIETFFAERFDPEQLLAFGKPFRITHPGLAIKLFPSQFATHYAITAATALASQISDKAKIRKVSITAPLLKHLNRPSPEDGLEGKHSLQYATGVALLDGSVKISTFSNERRFRPDIVNLLPKTELIFDPAIPQGTHEMHMTVKVELDDGKSLSETCRGPKGIWGQLLSPSDHRPKLEDCFKASLKPDSANELMSLLEEFDALDNKRVRRVVSLISSTE